MAEPKRLHEAARLHSGKILDQAALNRYGGVSSEAPVLVILAAGKGTRFGRDPKCIQIVHGTPLARHSIDAFRRFSASPVVGLVGYRYEDVAGALGDDNIYVRSDDPAGGTAYAAYEAFSVAALKEANPLLVITMGDRIVPSTIFRQLCEVHRRGEQEADLTFLSAVYEPPKNRGKGRVVRDSNGRVSAIVEEKDIHALTDSDARQRLLDLTEGNCPLYAVRAATLERYLRDLTNDNAQGQFYITDIIAAISRDGGEIRTITTTAAQPEYDLLCSDVTQPMDLALLEGTLASARGVLFPDSIEEAAMRITAGRPAAQIASIQRQLREILFAVELERLGFDPERPVGIGISGGRFRIAFMHPDMMRFYGPAWQMPIGAGSEQGDEQVVVLVQAAADRRLHLFPINPNYREKINSLPSDSDVLYPGDEISDWHAYEEFGTRMSENLLLSLGYFSDEELEARRRKGQPVPPPSLWVSNNMRRPFALVKNAIASMRTLRTGNLGARVQEHLGRETFRGLRMVSTGSIPMGGFSSSSAVTVATENAINAIWNLGIPPDLLVHLACQAEYGTGVRAGSLDQATEQKGQAGRGTLMSSNPRDNYRILGTYPVPTERYQILFPYSVDRDRVAWRWSGGAYHESVGAGPLTTSEARKMTGKSAELAALLTRLPLQTDFFKPLEEDLVADGRLSRENREWICVVLRQLPLLASQAELRERAMANRDWYRDQLMEFSGLDREAASLKAHATIGSLFAGWRDARLRRSTPSGDVIEERGVPLRAMAGYLFGEVAKNFYLIHHQERWIELVSRSQRGDCSFAIDADRLPDRAQMESQLEWERDSAGPERLNAWLERFGAVPFDYNAGLDDASLSVDDPPEFHLLPGSNFFRGLALIDLAEAMLKRAFGPDAVAVRVNAAGQGDYFQVHVDKEKADPGQVKHFLSVAFYRRFGLTPVPEFVEVFPGGGAVGVRLDRYADAGRLVERLGRQR